MAAGETAWRQAVMCCYVPPPPPFNNEIMEESRGIVFFSLHAVDTFVRRPACCRSAPRLDASPILQ